MQRPPGNDGPRLERRDPRPWPFRTMHRGRALGFGATLLSVMIVALAIGVTGVTVSRQDVGHVGVVRNGGPPPRRHTPPNPLPRPRPAPAGRCSPGPPPHPPP